MAKYAVLKVERDDVVARAVEAERNSQLENVRRLEAELARVTVERDETRMWSERMRRERDELKDFIREFSERSAPILEER